MRKQLLVLATVTAFTSLKSFASSCDNTKIKIHNKTSRDFYVLSVFPTEGTLNGDSTKIMAGTDATFYAAADGGSKGRIKGSIEVEAKTSYNQNPNTLSMEQHYTFNYDGTPSTFGRVIDSAAHCNLVLNVEPAFQPPPGFTSSSIDWKKNEPGRFCASSKTKSTHSWVTRWLIKGYEVEDTIEEMNPPTSAI